MVDSGVTSTRSVRATASPPVQEWSASGALLSNTTRSSQPPFQTETKTSFNHKMANLGHGDVGGPFSHRRTTIKELPYIWNETLTEGLFKGRRLTGPGYATSNSQLSAFLSDMIPLAPYGSDAAMDAYGTTAIARSAPTSPSVSLYQTLGELRSEGLPRFGVHTMKDRTKVAKNAGDDYLNVQFGWMPLVSDLRGYANMIRDSGAIVRQYKRDAGRPVRRRVEMLNTKTVTTGNTAVGGSYTDPLPSSKFLGAGGTRRWRQEVHTRVWFSGCFIYNLPVPDSAMDKLWYHVKLADRLLGITPTPDRIWELTPWSWFVDWFTNTGDILSNLRMFLFDGLVMQYGYVMQETKVTRTCTLEDNCTTVNGNKITAVTTIEHVAQKRRQANPFGFGLTWDGLSPYQISILAALGMTRGG